ncbi:MAG: exo-alpha-sialidase [Clostridia bacterium]|nr:exo-alpha-sialidase [Clostridia bacterium]
MLITDKTVLASHDSAARRWQGIPSIERTAKGRIFACWYSGGETEQMGNYSLLVYSDDDGKTFSDPIAVADVGESGRAYDPTLWIDPLGRLWFFWSVMPNNRVEFTLCCDPDAEVLTFGEVRMLGWDVMLNKPIVTQNDDWLFPCAVWKRGMLSCGLGSEQNPVGAHVFRSRDKGETFEKIGTAIARDGWYDEHMLLEHKDGSLSMYIRSRYGIAVARSTDGGVTWSEPRDSGLGGPNSRFHVKRLRSGNILLVNHYRFTGRSHMTALLSTDDGETFPYHLLLDERRDVSYPDAVEAENGDIYVIYDRERGANYHPERDYTHSAREILMAKITEADILAGELRTETSRTKQIVHKIVLG